MQLETDVERLRTTITKSVVLVRVEQNYHQDGSIEVAAYFAERTVYPDGQTITGALMPYQATYASVEAMVESAANTANIDAEQIRQVLNGYINLVWGMKAHIEQQSSTLPAAVVSPLTPQID